MARKTTTEHVSRKTTKTVEYETAETVETEQEVLVCDVCGREVPADLDQDEAIESDVEMYSIGRQKDLEMSMRLEGQPSEGLITDLKPGEIHLSDVDTFRQLCRFFIEDRQIETTELSAIGGTRHTQIEHTVGTELHEIDRKQGLLIAAGLNRMPNQSISDQPSMSASDLQVRLDLSHHIDTGVPTGKHVCAYCWDELFGGDDGSDRTR